MPYAIDIDIEVPTPPGTLQALETAVIAALDALRCQPEDSLAIVLADDDYLRALNSQFRQEDHATDVLSFPSGEPIPGLPETMPYLGDIAISVPYAERQARKQGHALLEELQLLAIHGVLHLLGYDHTSKEEKDDMWQMQAAILGGLGLSHVQPTEAGNEP